MNPAYDFSCQPVTIRPDGEDRQEGTLMRSIARRTNALRGRKKAVTYLGAAAALVGAGTATGVAVSSAAHEPAAVVRHTSAAAGSLTADAATREAVVDALAAAKDAVTHAAPAAAPANHVAAAKDAVPAKTAAPVKKAAPAKEAAPARTVAPLAKPAPAKMAAPVAKPAPAKMAAPVAKPSPAKTAAPVTTPAPAKAAAPAAPVAPAAPKPVPPADQLQPVGTAGPQAWMPLSPAQLSNATTIVQQAMARGMGARSAVIAVATAMQESQLQNLPYGDQDSLGLFQQRPSMGWGTAQQILTPKYAANAFLTALAQQQASSPGWASQPLWVTAQAVQKSGFPMAYAKWETQAVQLVKNVTHAR
jgi:hypothetical protein